MIQELNGFWELKIDRDDSGRNNNWKNGFNKDAIIGVPGSWNEQLSEIGLMDYVGSIWYQRQFYIQPQSIRKQYVLRFDSADFSAEVWLNGQWIGKHQGGFLPFEFEISEFVKEDQPNRLTVCVDNRLNHDTIPQGIFTDDYIEFGKQRDQSYPSTVFDFMAYGGLNRSVRLLVLPAVYMEKVNIDTQIHDSTGILYYRAEFSDNLLDNEIIISVYDEETCIDKRRVKEVSKMLEGQIEIKKCEFWCPDNPKLYSLQFELFEGGYLLDEYSIEFGIREIKLHKNKILLNGDPIFLKGFGKHEDFPVLGKGLSHPLIIKDFELMKWIGANSFRTSHYPYSEEIMQMADRTGFLIIDEVPAVSMNFKYVTDKTLQNHKTVLTELINRDRNHPSVIAWSVANEPGIWGEKEAVSSNADKYWKEIFNHVKKMDISRPITLPTCAVWKNRDIAYKYSDFISVNRYWGWYEMPGEIEKAGAKLKEELLSLFKLYHKPILLSEFGADTVEGLHSTYPQLFSEEYQTDLINEYFKVIKSLPFTIGEHIWNFADFRTAQHHRRIVVNKKGVFNRQREPKSAAFMIRKYWTKK